MSAVEADDRLTGGCQCGAVRYRLTGASHRRQHLPLSDVPEGRRRSVHGFRRRRSPRALRFDARRAEDLSQFGDRRARLLRPLRHAADLSR